MRFVAALLFWLVTTAALAVAVPAAWAQQNVVDADGYAALAALGGQGSAAAGCDGLRADHADEDADRRAAGTTSTPTWCAAGRRVHREPGVSRPVRAVPTESRTAGCSPTPSPRPAVRDGRWVIDLAPMLAD